MSTRPLEERIRDSIRPLEERLRALTDEHRTGSVPSIGQRLVQLDIEHAPPLELMVKPGGQEPQR